MSKFLFDFSLTPMNIVINVVGIIGLVFFVASFQAKKRQYLLLCQITSLVLFGVQYLLLGAYTGLILEIICIIRNLCFYFRNKVKWFDTIATPIVFGIAAVVVGIFTIKSEGWIAILPIIANIFQTVGLYLRSELGNRSLYLCSSPLWLAYNIVSNTLFGTLTEVLNIISIIISIIRIKKGNINNKGDHTPTPKNA